MAVLNCEYPMRRRVEVEIPVGLARLLPLTTVALVIVVLTVSTITLLWNGAPAQIEEGVIAVAASLGSSGQDGAALQTMVDGIASSMGAQSLRVVDLDLATLAYASRTPEDVPDIGESDARSL